VPPLDFKYRVVYQGGKRILNGKADYTSWHYPRGDMGAHHIICEAKSKGDALEGTGIIHKKRKAVGAKYCIVYGVVSRLLQMDFYSYRQQLYGDPDKRLGPRRE
jgi:hypothetical protein